MKEYIFRKEQKTNWNEQLSTLNNSLQAILDNAKGDFVVKIEDYKESSPKALRGYFRLIGVIKNYVNSVNNENWTKDEMSDHFKLLAGYSFKFDMMPMWKMQYKNHNSNLHSNGGLYYFDNGANLVYLGERFVKKPKSLKRKHGCTYEEMSKLIETLIDFGSDIPDCILTTTEDMEFKKYYGVK